MFYIVLFKCSTCFGEKFCLAGVPLTQATSCRMIAIKYFGGNWRNSIRNRINITKVGIAQTTESISIVSIGLFEHREAAHFFDNCSRPIIAALHDYRNRQIIVDVNHLIEFLIGTKLAFAEMHGTRFRIRHVTFD